jgi:hypothetical protein
MKLRKNTIDALEWIVGILDKHKLAFQISGGLAVKVYGSKRKLVDIDIDIKDKDFVKIIKEVKKYAIFGPRRFKDKNWDLMLMTLNYRGQKIDICGKAKIYDKNNKKWIQLKPVTSIYQKINGMYLPFTPKKDLIWYKNKLLRKVDILDIRELNRSSN